ncbi:hypothetical protein T06_4265, partial [Trichinella sp. T6]
LAGEYTIHYWWRRKWRAGIQFCLGGGNSCRL